LAIKSLIVAFSWSHIYLLIMKALYNSTPEGNVSLLDVIDLSSIPIETTIKFLLLQDSIVLCKKQKVFGKTPS